MEISSLVEIWKYLSWLPEYFLKRIFSKERLADLMIVDVRSRYDCATADLGPIGKFDLWFQVINMSPFEVELDRADIQFTCAGTALDSHYIKRTTFKAGEIAEFHVKGDISEGKAEQITQHHDKNASWISMDMDFNCALHSFSKRSHTLEGVRTRILNHNRSNETKAAGRE